MKSNAEKLAKLLTAALAKSPELSSQLSEVLGTGKATKSRTQATPTREERQNRIKAMFNQMAAKEQTKKHE
ncbi:MAG: hypothetical protein HZA79_04995 [Sphingobacteriales bacterium]|nr:hypothetical protein [Sphingobacteriales bacterium]